MFAQVLSCSERQCRCSLSEHAFSFVCMYIYGFTGREKLF
jgi:hypothetical protein